MFYLANYEAYVCTYLTNCGENPNSWDVRNAAMELRDALDGKSPDEMENGDFYLIILKNAISRQ
jgi:hypothetical protein